MAQIQTHPSDVRKLQKRDMLPVFYNLFLRQFREGGACNLTL